MLAWRIKNHLHLAHQLGLSPLVRREHKLIVIQRDSPLIPRVCPSKCLSVRFDSHLSHQLVRPNGVLTHANKNRSKLIPFCGAWPAFGGGAYFFSSFLTISEGREKPNPSSAEWSSLRSIRPELSRSKRRKMECQSCGSARQPKACNICLDISVETLKFHKVNATAPICVEYVYEVSKESRSLAQLPTHQLHSQRLVSIRRRPREHAPF